MIMGAGFNWAPPSVLVDTMGLGPAIGMIEEAGLDVPRILAERAAQSDPEAFFQNKTVNVGKYFVAA
jgi:hypothetical protein